MPEKTDGYLVFSTCRNPYDRLVALWNSILFSNGNRPDKHGYRDTWLSVLRNDDFETFAKFAAKHKDDIEYVAKVRMPTLMTPQYRWYDKLPAHTIPLHLENIKDEFNALTFVEHEVNIPHALKRTHASWDELKNERIIHYANQWAGKDFEKFGYIKEEI
jgi:hypothetical protein